LTPFILPVITKSRKITTFCKVQESGVAQKPKLIQNDLNFFVYPVLRTYAKYLTSISWKNLNANYSNSLRKRRRD